MHPESGQQGGPTSTAVIETSMGAMTVALFDGRVPNTVANFMHLASTGFYDGLKFHRVIADFMVQGGCPKGDGTGGPAWEIADEFVDELKHDSAGILSMANAGPNTNGSQFFITLVPTPWLDGRHTVFGKLVGGLDVLERIGAVKTDGRDRPTQPVTVEKVTLYQAGQPLTGELPPPQKL